VLHNPVTGIRQPGVLVGLAEHIVAKSFPSDFYVTCATVIPVLFVALIVQGGAYEAMLRTALDAAQTLPRRNRDIFAAHALPVAAYLTFVAGLIGEALALFFLYRGADTHAMRIIVLIMTLILLVVVTAVPGWKWWRAQQAVIRQRLKPIRADVANPEFGFGVGPRPLWTERDRDAERIRIILRDAGCSEFGSRRGGFVVEGGNPFLVACALFEDASAVAKEIKTYTEALTAAGFRVAPLPGLDDGLKVWSIDA
jgi:hypothetical protein